ncbi:tetratricopeptide repeat protein [Myxococcus sp. K15C18031901]|uniref:tetratricopeptide repeat protein n=1 Tax=Myxococcus dinghuensis TaxID=2906761 RepID=UPI0020A7AD4A|nr:tetratricopeptide repeat protein [Myxococcus dinghuensis]MCP3097286.1 tetratricopeptide repeat protein [Myxococcus dinghuensis]
MTLTPLVALLLLASPKPLQPMPKKEFERARQLEAQAREAQRAGRFMDAEKPLLDAISLWTRYRGAQDIEVLNDTMNLAVAYRRHGAPERGIPLLEKAVEGLAACADSDAPELRRKAMNNLATAYHFANRLQEARKTYEALLALLDEQSPSEERARVIDNFASLLLDQRDRAGAKALARKGYAEWLALRGEDDQDTAVSLSTLGAIESAMGEQQEARRHLEQSLRTSEKLLGRDHPNIGAVLNLLAVVEVRSGNPAEARALYERSLVISRARLSPDHIQIKDALLGLQSLAPAADAGTRPR